MAAPKPREVQLLVLDNGRCPFDEWLSTLNNAAFVHSVDARLTRVRDGNFGDHRSVGGGVFELRIPRGPGLRVYYAMQNTHEVVILGGGDKNTQRRDVIAAQKLWKQIKR